METAYVKRETTKMFLDAARKRSIELLWGDQVRIVERNGNVAKVKARGQTGTVSTNDLGPDALLELYFVDVGQGDGVLIRTPDGRHVLIDAGYNRAKQAMGKNAADFVDWKFCKDYGAAKIELDVVIASHNDADHYGGLWDLLNPAAEARGQLDIPTKDVSVEAFYHAGIGWWKGPGMTGG